jgi:hypothetical protein
MQHGALAHLLSGAAHRHEIAKVRRGGPRFAPEEPELYNTKAALEGWVSNLWYAKSYRRHSPKPQKSPTTLVMDSNGRVWLYCTCEWRTVYRDHLESVTMNASGVAQPSVQHLDCHALVPSDHQRDYVGPVTRRSATKHTAPWRRRSAPLGSSLNKAPQGRLF